MSNQAILEEVWLSRLAARSGTELETCQRLWATLHRQIEARLALGCTIDLGRLGLWHCQLTTEYIGIVEGGTRYLIPPSSSLCIAPSERGTASKTLSLEALGESIASLSGITPTVCATILRAIEPLAVQQLEAGRSISLPHIGTLTPQTDAESGAVVGFGLLPAEDLRSALNKAFSMFAPVPLVAEEASRGLDEVRLTTLEALHEPKVIEVSWLPTEDIAAETVGLAKSSEAIAPEAEVPSVSKASIVPLPTSPLPCNEEVQTTSTPTPLHSAEEPAPSEGEVMTAPPQNEDTPTEEGKPRQRRRHAWWLVLLGLIALGTLGYLHLKPTDTEASLPAHTLEATTEREPATLEGETIFTEEDSITATEVPSEPSDCEVDTPTSSAPTAAPPPPPAPRAEEPAKQPTASQAQETEHITISGGEGLMQISLRKYGHKAFWVYIYEENRGVITNYNNIPLGTRLTLPSARKYGINANDTNSLNRALVLQRALLREQ